MFAAALIIMSYDCSLELHCIAVLFNMHQWLGSLDSEFTKILAWQSFSVPKGGISN